MDPENKELFDFLDEQIASLDIELCKNILLRALLRKLNPSPEALQEFVKELAVYITEKHNTPTWQDALTEFKSSIVNLKS